MWHSPRVPGGRGRPHIAVYKEDAGQEASQSRKPEKRVEGGCKRPGAWAQLTAIACFVTALPSLPPAMGSMHSQAQAATPKRQGRRAPLSKTACLLTVTETFASQVVEPQGRECAVGGEGRRREGCSPYTQYNPVQSCARSQFSRIHADVYMR